MLGNGIVAKEAAERGAFVVAGLEGKDHDPRAAHGHVVVVVVGPLAKNKYPSAYWGSLGCEGAKCDTGHFNTINFAWTTEDRDRVIYAAKSF